MNYLKLALLSLIAIIGTSCTDDENNNGSAGVPLDIKEVNKIISQNPEYFVVEGIEVNCEGTRPDTSTTQDTIYYEIKDGKLYSHGKNECTKLVFEGTSSTLKGTWVSDLTEVASGISPCDSSGIGELKQFMTNPKMTVEVTDDNVTMSQTGSICFGTILTDMIGLMGSDPDLTGGLFEFKNVKSSGCNHMSYTIFIGGLSELDPSLEDIEIPVTTTLKDLGNGEMEVTQNVDGCVVTSKFSTTEFTGGTDCSAEEEEDPFGMGQMMQECGDKIGPNINGLLKKAFSAL